MREAALGMVRTVARIILQSLEDLETKNPLLHWLTPSVFLAVAFFLWAEVLKPLIRFMWRRWRDPFLCLCRRLYRCARAWRARVLPWPREGSYGRSCLVRPGVVGAVGQADRADRSIPPAET